MFDFEICNQLPISQGLHHRIGFTLELCYIGQILSSKIIAVKTEKFLGRKFQGFGRLNDFFTYAFSQNFPPPMIGKNFKTFQTFSSTKIIVENIACLELFLMSFSKYPISNV